jgi:hypothetical protein
VKRWTKIRECWQRLTEWYWGEKTSSPELLFVFINYYISFSSFRNYLTGWWIRVSGASHLVASHVWKTAARRPEARPTTSTSQCRGSLACIRYTRSLSRATTWIYSPLFAYGLLLPPLFIFIYFFFLLVLRYKVYFLGLFNRCTFHFPRWHRDAANARPAARYFLSLFPLVVVFRTLGFS